MIDIRNTDFHANSHGEARGEQTHSEAVKAQGGGTAAGPQDEATARPEDTSEAMTQREGQQAHSEAAKAKMEGADDLPHSEALPEGGDAATWAVHGEGGDTATWAAHGEGSERKAWHPTMLGVHLSGVGVACWGHDEQHFTFLPDDPVEGRCQKYRLPGVGQQLEDGTFVFQPRAALPQRAQSVLICQLPHGRLSLTRDHAIQLTLKMRLARHTVPDIARFIMEESGEVWEELTLWHESREQQSHPEGEARRAEADRGPARGEAQQGEGATRGHSDAKPREQRVATPHLPLIIESQVEERSEEAHTRGTAYLNSQGAWKGSSTTRPS